MKLLQVGASKNKKLSSMEVLQQAMPWAIVGSMVK